VLIKGGNIRGGRDYGHHEYFTLEMLKSEMMETQEIFVVDLPGAILRVGLRETWHAPNPGWFQIDDKVLLDDEGCS
jgi:hypothetical protein